MKPWVALPGACRLSRVTSDRQPSRSPFAIHSTALRVELRVGPVRAELARAAELQRQVAGADDRHPLVARPRLDQLAERPAELDEPLRLRQRRGEDVGVDRHDRQVVLRAQRDDRAGDAVVDAQLVAEREVEAGVEARRAGCGRTGRGRPCMRIRGRPNSRSSLYQLASYYSALADQELRHVVQPQLVEVVGADHHQHVRAGPGQRLAERLDLAHPLGRERRRLLRRAVLAL